MIDIDRTSKESHALSWVRLPMAALVVLIHTNFSTNTKDAAYYIGTLLSANIANVAVPTFFLISGYLFFARYESFGLKEYTLMLKNKIFTLLLPYLLWNFIAYYGYGLINHFECEVSPWDFYRIFWAESDGYISTSVFGYTFSILSTPIVGPLWFVRDLMVVMFFSPVIWLLIRCLKLYSIFVFIVIWILRIGIPIKGFGLEAFCFFPVGAAFSICGNNIFNIISRYWNWIITLFLISLFIVYLDTLNVLQFEYPLFFFVDGSSALFKLSGVLCALGIAYRLCMKSMNISTLGESSFFIYAFHTLFIFYPLHLLTDHLLLIPVLGGTLNYFVSFFIKLFVSIGIYYAMKRWCPIILNLLVGGRLKGH